MGLFIDGKPYVPPPPPPPPPPTVTMPAVDAMGNVTGGTVEVPAPAPKPATPEDRSKSECVTCSEEDKKKNKDKKKFSTVDGAATDAMKEYNPRSIRENREFGGMIERNPDGTFSRGDAVNRGGLDSVRLPKPEGETAGWWHTHGAYDPKYDSENFSPADMNVSRYHNVPGYVATPEGSMQRFDPGTGAVTRLPGVAR